jgi:two-component system chemotaxis response regulator CheY
MARILVCDDSKFMRLTLKSYIEKSSQGKHQVIGEAEDDAAALQRYKELRPDAVTMDIIMPTVSGIKAVRDIIAFDASACIVMVSAMGQDGVLEEAIKAGARGYIRKPLKAEDLVTEIDKALGK